LVAALSRCTTLALQAPAPALETVGFLVEAPKAAACAAALQGGLRPQLAGAPQPSIHHSLFNISCAPFSELIAHLFGAWVFDLDVNLERCSGVGDGLGAVAELVEGQTHVEKGVAFAPPVADLASAIGLRLLRA
jgi:hypothetical protein